MMKLYYDKRSKDPIYYAQQGVRNGKKVTTRNVKRFGKHSELLLICDDPLDYVKNEIKKMNDEYRIGKATVEFNINFNEKVSPSDHIASHSNYLNIGYLYLQDIYRQLHLNDFFKEISDHRRITFDCDLINRFLTFARILDPRSKLGTFDNLDTYFEKPDFTYQHIHRFMDLLYPYFNEYIEHLYKESNNIIHRDSSIIYYDCTNFYFESETYDEDYIDEVTGEVFKGLRQYGISKENRTNPLVEMGLIIDKRGIPITMSIEPGNTNEQTTAIPLETSLMKITDNSKFIYIADGGLGSYNIRKFNSMGGRAFIVTQSIKKLSDDLKKAVFNDYDYKLLSNDHDISIEHMKSFNKQDKENLTLYNDRAYKVVIADKVVDLGLEEYKTYQNGKTKKVKAKGTLKQKLIITFSRKVMEYQRLIRNRQIERAKKLLKINDPEEIKKGPNDIRRFLKREAKGSDGKQADVTYTLDMEKIKKEEMYDGFYCIATNLDDDIRDIIEIMEQRYQIEENFRIIKTYFDGRPVFHYTPNKIKVHFLICFTSLLIYRILEAKLEDQETPVTIEKLIETLKNMNIVNIHDFHYMALYDNSYTLKALEKNSPLMLDRKYYRPKELNKLCKKLSK